MKQLTRYVSLAALSACTFVTLPAHAAFDPNNAYVGVSGGTASADVDRAALEADLTSLGHTINSLSVDDNAGAWKLYGGYKFHPNFAIELSYVDTGEVTSSGSMAPAGTVDGLLTDITSLQGLLVRGVTVEGVAFLEVSPTFDLFMKMGLINWEADSTATAGATSASQTFDGTDFTWGAGAEWRIPVPHAPLTEVGIRFEYQRYNIDRNDIDAGFLGLVAHF